MSTEIGIIVHIISNGAKEEKMTKVECPHCDKRVDLESEATNQVALDSRLMVECPGCEKRFVIPDYLEVIADGFKTARIRTSTRPRGRRNG